MLQSLPADVPVAALVGLTVDLLLVDVHLTEKWRSTGERWLW